MLRAALVLLAAAALGGCAQLGYYSQAARGHFDILGRREPIETLLTDPALDPKLRQRLLDVRDARRFASAELALPDNASYTAYADIERPFATWVVVATPEFGTRARQWCFPFTGCISYRGYFSERDAEAFADSLRAEGLDVAVAGSSAYSTLGWFDDPVLNTMFNRPTWAVAGVLFHELSHQRLYVRDDSAFSEAYAVAVERAGVRRWLVAGGRTEELAAFEASLERRTAFTRIVLEARSELADLYASAKPSPALREAKASVFDSLRERHATLRESWGGASPYDRWFAQPLNNARLALVATYDEMVPTFDAMLEEAEGDFEAFHVTVELFAQARKQAN